MKKHIYSNKPYIIAETAYSFEGDKKYLLSQTSQLSDKIDAIKYHMLMNIDEYMAKEHPLYELLKKWIITKEDWKEILIAAKNKNLDTIVLVDDTDSIKFCSENNHLIDAIEVHAACVNDIDLLDKAVEFSIDYNKVFVLGISGFEIQELLDITEYLKDKNVNDLLMMYGFQNYPTNISEVNLSKIKVLEDILKYKIGYADHTEYSNQAKELLIYSSFALGVNVQEIHYVLEEGVKRTDYITGVSNARLEKIKSDLENIYKAIGSPDFRLNEGEKKYLNFRKVPVYKSDLVSEQVLERSLIAYKRVETPIRQHKFNELNEYFGKIIIKDVKKGMEVIIGDLKEKDNDY